MGALSSLNLSANRIGKFTEGAEVLSTAFKGNSVLTELDLSNNGFKAEGALLLADGIGDMKELSTLVFGGDGVRQDESTGWKKVPYEPATLEVGMIDADFSNQNLGASGAIIVGAWLTHKDNGALSSLNLSENVLCGVSKDPFGNQHGTFDPAGTSCDTWIGELTDINYDRNQCPC
jgi:hypothetical protein